MSVLLAAMPLAKSGEAVKAGPIGLAVILILCIGCYFLFKSMSKHLKNVRENFPDETPGRAPVTTPAVVVPVPVQRTGATTDEDGQPVPSDS